MCTGVRCRAVTAYLQVVVPQGVQRDLQAPRAILALFGGAHEDHECRFDLIILGRSVGPVDVQAGEDEREQQRGGHDQGRRVHTHNHVMLRTIIGRCEVLRPRIVETEKLRVYAVDS